MSSVNKVILVGNLGQDPDVRQTAGGQAVATLSLATSFKTQEAERTEWHRVIVWGKLAELAQRYLAKGRKVYVEGRLQTRSWDDNGTKRYATEVVANELVFLDGGAAREESGRHAGQTGRAGRPAGAGQGGQGNFDEKAPF